MRQLPCYLSASIIYEKKLAEIAAVEMGKPVAQGMGEVEKD